MSHEEGCPNCGHYATSMYYSEKRLSFGLNEAIMFAGAVVAIVGMSMFVEVQMANEDGITVTGLGPWCGDALWVVGFSTFIWGLLRKAGYLKGEKHEKK